MLRLLVAAAAGALLSAALPSVGAWPLLAALAIPFALAASAERARGAFGAGAATGAGFFALHVLWLPLSFAELFGPAFWLTFPFLVAVLAAFWGLVTWAARLVGGRGRATLWVLPFFWVLMEWARAQGYFGFPWGTLGYAWLDAPPGQIADVIGVQGLSLLSAAVAALLAVPFVRPSYGEGAPGTSSYRARGGGRGAITAVLCAALLLGGAWTAGLLRERAVAATLESPDRTALLVQPVVDPFGRALGAGGELAVLSRVTRDALAALPEAPDLVAWPEGAVLGGFRGYGGFTGFDEVQALAPESTMVIGARAVTPGVAGSFNRAFAVVEGQPIASYDKTVLVPFGERWPLYGPLGPLYRAVFGVFGLGALEPTLPGAEAAVLDTPAGVLGTYICYESVFPRLQRRMAANGAQVLLTITNDAWFSRGDGARQHWDMGRMRAIETRRWLLRSSIDGITGVIDPLGRGVEELPRRQRGALAASYALRDDVTPWVRWGALAPWLWAGSSLLAAFGAAMSRMR